MATTTNFNWETPDDSDLVKDGAAAIRTALNGVDTSFVDLKGGTTGQVLSKASGTDLDFTWVAQDDSNAIQNAIVDAKGDIIAATAADTPARLAVGTNGQVLTADSTASTGLAWTTIPTATGGMTSLASGSLSSTSVSVSITPTGYNDLQIYVRNFSFSGDGYFGFRINNETAYNYWWIYQEATSATASAQAAVGDTRVYTNSPLDYLAGDYEAVIRIFDINSTTSRKVFQMIVSGNNNTNSFKFHGISNGAWCGTPAAITSIQLLEASGQTFTGGTYQVFGVK